MISGYQWAMRQHAIVNEFKLATAHSDTQSFRGNYVGLLATLGVLEVGHNMIGVLCVAAAEVGAAVARSRERRKGTERVEWVAG
jgi:hypothetical protein